MKYKIVFNMNNKTNIGNVIAELVYLSKIKMEVLSAEFVNDTLEVIVIVNTVVKNKSLSCTSHNLVFSYSKKL